VIEKAGLKPRLKDRYFGQDAKTAHIRALSTENGV